MKLRRLPGRRDHNRRVDRARGQRRRARLRWGLKAGALAAVAVAGAWHGLRLADARGWLDLFRVREVRVAGIRVANPNVLVAEAGLMGAEVHWWSPLGLYAERVKRDPLVADARFVRRFPNRLTLEIVEREPIAFLRARRLAPVDSVGRVLPVSAYHPAWDAPVLTTAWEGESLVGAGRVRVDAVRETLGWLGQVSRQYPALMREISAVELDRAGNVTLRLVRGGGSIVLDHGTPIEKLALVDDVLRDLHEKGIRFSRLDLRFEDQIVVRRG